MSFNQKRTPHNQLTNEEKNAIACGMNQNNNYKSNGKLFEQIFAQKQRPQTDKYSTTANTLTRE